MAMMTTTIVMMTPVDHDIDDRGPNNDRHGGRTSDGQRSGAGGNADDSPSFCMHVQNCET